MFKIVLVEKKNKHVCCLLQVDGTSSFSGGGGGWGKKGSLKFYKYCLESSARKAACKMYCNNCRVADKLCKINMKNLIVLDL